MFINLNHTILYIPLDVAIKKLNLYNSQIKL
jgi:hypothetical protein